MPRAKPAVYSLLPAILLALPVLGTAQEVDLVDISACRAIADRLQRFDCYEKLEAVEAAAPGQEAPRQSPVTPPAQVPAVPAVTEPAQPAPVFAPAPATPDTQVENFGRGPETARVREIEGGNGGSELTDTIAAIERRLPNRALVTLSSGQKWMQMLDKRYPLRVGDEVRIYPTQWGSAYRLTAARLSGYIQVQRID